MTLLRGRRAIEVKSGTTAAGLVAGRRRKMAGSKDPRVTSDP